MFRTSKFLSLCCYPGSKKSYQTSPGGATTGSVRLRQRTGQCRTHAPVLELLGEQRPREPRVAAAVQAQQHGARAACIGTSRRQHVGRYSLRFAAQSSCTMHPPSAGKESSAQTAVAGCLASWLHGREQGRRLHAACSIPTCSVYVECGLPLWAPNSLPAVKVSGPGERQRQAGISRHAGLCCLSVSVGAMGVLCACREAAAAEGPWVTERRHRPRRRERTCRLQGSAAEVVVSWLPGRRRGHGSRH